MTDNNPSHKKLANPYGGPKYSKPTKGPTRPDRAMRAALQANRSDMIRAGLDPDNLPWQTRNGIVYSTTNFQRLGTTLYVESSDKPFFDRWHHKRTGE